MGANLHKNLLVHVHVIKRILFFLHCLISVVIQRVEIVPGQATEITSPDYPSPYLSKTSTLWIVQVASEKLLITFSSFSTVQDQDFIYVGDGDVYQDDSSRFFKWSGTNQPPRLLSNGATVWIIFNSTSGSASNLGFNLTILMVPQLGECLVLP